MEWPASRKAIAAKRVTLSAGKPLPAMAREIESQRLRLATINETPSIGNSSRDSRAFIDSPRRTPDVESARGPARRDEDSSSDFFYDNMLANIDGILGTSSVSESGGDLTRSSCSPTPPRVSARRMQSAPRREIDRHDEPQQQHYSAETIYINRLASKYLVTERKEPIRRSQQPREGGRDQHRRPLAAPARRDYDVDVDVRVFGISREVSSVATKNYLEKYGLLNDQLNVSRAHYSQRRTAASDHHHQPAGKSNRILDLDRLKRQPKYT